MPNNKPDSLQDLMAIVNSADIGLVILDKLYVIRVWNLFMVKHSGVTAESAIGQNLLELFPYISQLWFAEKVLQSITQKQKLLCTWEEQPYLFKFKIDRSRTMTSMYQNITFIPLVSANGDVENFALTISDVTDIAATTQHLGAVISEYTEQ